MDAEHRRHERVPFRHRRPVLLRELVVLVSGRPLRDPKPFRLQGRTRGSGVSPQSAPQDLRSAFSEGSLCDKAHWVATAVRSVRHVAFGPQITPVSVVI